MNILFLSPLRICRPWTVGERILQSYFLSPVMTFAQLAAQVDDAHVRILDSQAEHIRLADFISLLSDVNVVAISLHSGIEAYDCEQTIALIKKNYPHIKIIIGGYHATYFFKRWLALGADYVIRYEGDMSFKKIITALKTGASIADIPNVAYKDKDVVVNKSEKYIRNLDDLPLPRYESVDYHKYYSCLSPNGYVGSVEISRGCLSRCSFCVTRSFWDNTYRRKSNNRIMEEIKAQIVLGVRTFWLYASSFGIQKEDSQALCQMIQELDVPIEWRTGMRLDTVLLYPDLVKKAARAGLRMVLIGFESFDANEISSTCKEHSVEYTYDNYKKAYRILRENNIVVEGAFIVGLSENNYPTPFRYAKMLGKVCDHVFLQCYRPNVAFLKKITDKNIDDPEYKRLFYFHGNVSTKTHDRKIFQQKRKLEYAYYANPLLILKRLCASSSVIRRMYRAIYAYLCISVFRMFFWRMFPFMRKDGFNPYRKVYRKIVC